MICEILFPAASHLDRCIQEGALNYTPVINISARGGKVFRERAITMRSLTTHQTTLAVAFHIMGLLSLSWQREEG